MSETRKLSDITVPTEGRQDLGNVRILAASIERVGLLHPLVLNTRNVLIAGRRRLAALKRLKWDEAPVRVVATLDDALLALKAEQDENSCREPLTNTEAVELVSRLMEIEKDLAKKRQASTGTARGRKRNASGNFPEAFPGQARDKAASAVDWSGRTYEKGKAAVDAAKADPEKFGDLPALMDTKSVDAAHRALRERQKPKPEVKPDERAKQNQEVGGSDQERAGPDGAVRDSPPTGDGIRLISGPAPTDGLCEAQGSDGGPTKPEDRAAVIDRDKAPKDLTEFFKMIMGARHLIRDTLAFLDRAYRVQSSDKLVAAIESLRDADRTLIGL